MRCLLCHAEHPLPFHPETLGDHYWHCLRCDYRFLNPKYRLSKAAEDAAYQRHENDVTDPRYRNFLQPIADAVQKHVPKGAAGLDFGAGPGPLLAQMLEEAGYAMALYDPLFHPNQVACTKRYAFVTSSEVVEHFHNPHEEMLRLKSLLLPAGKLAIMTLLYHSGIDFRHWHYRREKSHVGFFSQRTFEWIATWAGFSGLECNGDRVIVLTL